MEILSVRLPLDGISHFRLDYGILGMIGIDLNGSLLVFDDHEVLTKQAIIDNASRLPRFNCVDYSLISRRLVKIFTTCLTGDASGVFRKTG